MRKVYGWKFGFSFSERVVSKARHDDATPAHDASGLHARTHAPHNENT